MSVFYTFGQVIEVEECPSPPLSIAIYPIEPCHWIITYTYYVCPSYYGRGCCELICCDGEYIPLNSTTAGAAFKAQMTTGIHQISEPKQNMHPRRPGFVSMPWFIGFGQTPLVDKNDCDPCDLHNPAYNPRYCVECVYGTREDDYCVNCDPCSDTPIDARSCGPCNPDWEGYDAKKCDPGNPYGYVFLLGSDVSDVDRVPIYYSYVQDDGDVQASDLTSDCLSHTDPETIDSACCTIELYVPLCCQNPYLYDPTRCYDPCTDDPHAPGCDPVDPSPVDPCGGLGTLSCSQEGAVLTICECPYVPCDDPCQWVSVSDGGAGFIWERTGGGCTEYCPCDTPVSVPSGAGETTTTICEYPVSPDPCSGECYFEANYSLAWVLVNRINCLDADGCTCPEPVDAPTVGGQTVTTDCASPLGCCVAPAESAVGLTGVGMLTYCLTTSQEVQVECQCQYESDGTNWVLIEFTCPGSGGGGAPPPAPMSLEASSSVALITFSYDPEEMDDANEAMVAYAEAAKMFSLLDSYTR